MAAPRPRKQLYLYALVMFLGLLVLLRTTCFTEEYPLQSELLPPLSSMEMHDLHRKGWTVDANKENPELVVGILTTPRDTSSQMPRLAYEAASERSAVIVQYRGDKRASLNASPKTLLRRNIIIVEAPGSALPSAQAQEVLDYGSLLQEMVKRFPSAQYFAVYQDDVRLAFESSTRLLDAIENNAQTLGHSWGVLTLFSGPHAPDTAGVLGSEPRVVHDSHRRPPYPLALVYRADMAKQVGSHLHAHASGAALGDLIVQGLGPALHTSVFHIVPNLAQHIGLIPIFKRTSPIVNDPVKSPLFFQLPSASLNKLSTLPAQPHIGCFREDLYDPDLSGLSDRTGHSKTPYRCARFCKDYLFFGLQTAGCFCGNEFGRYGKVNEDLCRPSCTNAPHGCVRPCGGAATQSIYRTGRTLETLSNDEVTAQQTEWLQHLCGPSNGVCQLLF